MEHQDDELMKDEQEKLVHEGVLQYYVNVQESQKIKKLVDLLDCFSFNQVIILVSNNERATQLDKVLKECSFPSLAVHSGLPLEERIEHYRQFKQGTAKILICNDISARSASMEKVNIVVNYDMPKPDEIETYLSRIGRVTGFGPKGLAISFVSTPGEMEYLKKVQETFLLKIDELPDSTEIEPDKYSKKFS